MSRRGEQPRMEFPYPPGHQAPNMTAQQQQQHHATPVQPPMNVPGQPQQQPPTGPPSQQQTPTQTPAQPPRSRKRQAPGQAPAASSPASTAPPSATATPAQAQAHAPGQAPPPPHVAPQQPPPGQQQQQHQPPHHQHHQHQPSQPQPHPQQGQQAHQTASQSQAPVNDVNAQTPVQPPAKKSRTNTPWTPQEELRLKQMRDAGNSWAEIAKTFPNRTEGSVKKHWYKDMHYAEFAEDESQALMNAIKEYENNKWKFIGQKVGKPAKACEQYAKENFPDRDPRESSAEARKKRS
ncbi:hypothetical protein ACRE_066780 [Hapsidospora chrysogenum ATCC 11550]|uniref:Uncharacterized protein n=1 Tax=Hapsidospora chrysogenum (strain ATCC 11550 / CBS 779.69 / DSM 880 / IAM 14645 / JCM 23072 / IMI 49137) TaxID=857340 RepID=A0A086SZP5_HAPC1|nr:hypothetical protein ACRE_066780 [Hapsidospora chrysogenum ATCC 11550]